MEAIGQPHTPAALPLGGKPDTHWIGGWAGPRAGLDAVAKREITLLYLPGIEPRSNCMIESFNNTSENILTVSVANHH
jgi:hypothetical protein